MIIALDVGTKTIGVARSHGVAFAEPWFTLARAGVAKDVAQLAQRLRAARPTQVVVGLPLELDGAEGRSCRLARQVGEALAAATGWPVAYQDERWSTLEAADRLHATGWSARDQKSQIDAAAAAVILEAWLRVQAGPSGGPGQG